MTVDRELPEFRALPDERAQVLWVLARAKQGAPSRLTASQISTVLREEFSMLVPYQRVGRILDELPKGTLARFRSRPATFEIMQLGLDELVSRSPSLLFIQPETAFTGIRTLEAILSQTTGDVRVCDPYIEGRSLDFLAACTASASIHLLTANVLKEARFRRDLTAFRQEHTTPIEVRRVTTNALHDRYIIDDASILLLGTSLNGIGRKQTFVVELGPDLRAAALSAFNREWAKATPFQ